MPHKNKIILYIIYTLACIASTTATYSETLDNQILEVQAQTLFQQLQCTVCEGQPIAGSEAELAQNIRSIIRNKLAQGESIDAIKSYLVVRYGEKILLEPPLSSHTLPLWIFPFMLLLIGASGLLYYLRRQHPL